jgi:ribonuclease VapC
VIAVDTSAVLAILKEEPEAVRFAGLIGAAEISYMSAISLLEASMVLISRGPAEFAVRLDRLIEEMSIDIVPVDRALAVQSRAAFIRFGKGRHPAGLNFGDCVSYALAQSLGLPLLYKGGDFAKTDIRSAL